MRSRLPSPVVLLSVLLISCDAQNTTVPAAAPQVFRSDTGATAYFGTPVNWADTVWLESLAASLRKAHEPPLRGAAINGGTTVLRFLWIRSFHPGVVIRVTRSSAGCTVATSSWEPDMLPVPTIDADTGLVPIGALIPGARLRGDSAQHSNALCESLATRVDALGLQKQGPHITTGGIDGAAWLFERLDAHGHTILYRFSPDCRTACDVFTAGMAFLRAGKALPAGPHELY